MCESHTESVRVGMSVYLDMAVCREMHMYHLEGAKYVRIHAIPPECVSLTLKA